MSLSPIAAAEATPVARPRPIVTTRIGGIVGVAAFTALSVALAAAATFGGVSPALLPFVLAFGPTAVALALAWREGDGAVRRLLRTAITGPNRRLWYAVVALPLVWAGATIAVAIALGQPTAGIFDKTFPAILFIPLLVLLPAFAEEIAWRGYAVTRLLPSMSPLAAALLLGVPWAALHIFLQLPGQMNAGLEVWPTIVSLLGYSVVLTWLFVASGGSVLLTALVHAGLNGVAPLMGGLERDQTWAIRALLVAALAVAIVAASDIRRRSAPQA